ncbi:hypothetical protein [Aquimonas sp.]|uniref:hypothetical protein n=1 Tax=Aquimonas sp. TaxID=1872588 RepID=UPI0037C17272
MLRILIRLLGLTGTAMSLPGLNSLSLTLLLALAVSCGQAIAQHAVPQPAAAPAPAPAPSEMRFEQPRLKLMLTAPTASTTSRTEHPTYDEVKVVLPNNLGELNVWTYSRRSYSAAGLLLSQKTGSFLDARIEARELGPLPALFLRTSSPDLAPLETRAIIDRPSFDWVYVIHAEATTKEAIEALNAVMESIRPL